MLAAVLGELTVRALALVLISCTAYTLARHYIAVLTDAGRAYLTIIDLLYSQDRLPLVL